MMMMMMTSCSRNPISISISSSPSPLPFSISHRGQYFPPASAPGTRTGIRTGTRIIYTKAPSYSIAGCASAQMVMSSSRGGGLIGAKIQKWWEKGLQPNMIEVKGAQHLVESLLNAGDRLVVVDFFSPGCAGCKSLHPKICQLAEMNPDVVFLHVNYEKHKSMCYSLNVHVLPFFRFYRGAHGRLCSFSCTNATIKKFKDALAKHSPERCGLGPTKGLEEKELLALAANKDLSFNFVPRETSTEEVKEALPSAYPLPTPPPLSTIRLDASSEETRDNKTLATLTK